MTQTPSTIAHLKYIKSITNQLLIGRPTTYKAMTLLTETKSSELTAYDRIKALFEEHYLSTVDVIFKNGKLCDYLLCTTTGNGLKQQISLPSTTADHQIDAIENAIAAFAADVAEELGFTWHLRRLRPLRHRR